MVSAEPGANLLRNPSFEESQGDLPTGWVFRSPRSEVAPDARTDDGQAHSGGRSLRMAGAGKPGAIGWVRSVRCEIKGGEVYELRAHYRAEDVPDVEGCLWVKLVWLSGGEGLVWVTYLTEAPAQDGGWWRLSGRRRAPDGASAAEVSLILRGASGGRVWWDDISLTEVPPGPPRRVRLATAYLPEEMRNPEGWMRALEEAGEGKADIVCLGEMVHVLPGAPRFPYPIPGPATDVLADAARHHNTTIVASLAEADGALQYNTGVVIGRNGRIAGRYRKTHLPQAEVEVGTTPGNTFPVFDTDIGRVGIQICYDHFFPEVSRMLALQGAEIIFTPIMGDVRTDMQAYEAVARARAIDNSVYYVTSIRDTGRSLIVDPSGTILADSNNEPGVVFADVDLDQEYWEPWLSVEGFGEFRRLWPKERRPERYAALLKRR